MPWSSSSPCLSLIFQLLNAFSVIKTMFKNIVWQTLALTPFTGKKYKNDACYTPTFSCFFSVSGSFSWFWYSKSIYVNFFLLPQHFPETRKGFCLSSSSMVLHFSRERSPLLHLRLYFIDLELLGMSYFHFPSTHIFPSSFSHALF